MTVDEDEREGLEEEVENGAVEGVRSVTSRGRLKNGVLDKSEVADDEEMISTTRGWRRESDAHVGDEDRRLEAEQDRPLPILNEKRVEGHAANLANLARRPDARVTRHLAQTLSAAEKDRRLIRLGEEEEEEDEGEAAEKNGGEEAPAPAFEHAGVASDGWSALAVSGIGRGGETLTNPRSGLKREGQLGDQRYGGKVTHPSVAPIAQAAIVIA